MCVPFCSKYLDLGIPTSDWQSLELMSGVLIRGVNTAEPTVKTTELVCSGLDVAGWHTVELVSREWTWTHICRCYTLLTTVPERPSALL